MPKNGFRLLALLIVLGSWGVAGIAAATCPQEASLVEVYDGTTHEPVAGAAIDLLPDATVVRTDAAGVACIPSPADAAVVRHRLFAEASVSLEPRHGARRIALSPLASLELTVQRSGEPVEGARVAWAAGVAEMVEAASDAEGRLVGVVGVAGESLALVIQGAGYATECRVIEELRRGTNAVKIDLRLPGTILVDVRDERGEPFEELDFFWTQDAATPGCAAELLGSDRTGRPAERAEEGGWTVGGLLPGAGMLEVVAPGYGRHWLGPVEVREGKESVLRPVELEPHRVVTGQVSTSSRRPLAEATVSALLAADGRSVAETKTDDEGRFEIEVPEAKEIILRAGDPPGPTGETPVTASRTKIIVPDPARIVGVVRSSEEAVRAAEVVATPLEARSWERAQLQRRTTTGEAGAFELANLREGVWRVEVSAVSFAPAVKAPIDLAQGGSRELRVELEPGLSVRGTVLDAATDEAVEGATVRTATAHPDDWVRTDENGSFSLAGVSRGIVRLIAEHPLIGAGESVADPEAGPVEIAITPHGEIEGWVTDREGTPLAGRRVEVRGVGVGGDTDPAGYYRIERVPSGPKRVVLRESLPGDHRLLSARDVDVVPRETLRVDFGGGLTVGGRFLRDGEPVRDGLVTFSRMNEGRPSGNVTDTLATTRTDRSGEYRINGLTSGPYTITARSERSAIYRSVELAEDKDNTFDLIMEASAVEGTVLDAERLQPVSGARVMAFDPRRSFGVLFSEWLTEDGNRLEAGQVLDEAWVAYSGADGRYTLALPEGRFRLEVSAPGFDSARHDLTITEDRTEQVELLLEPTWSLIGTIVDQWGHPVSGAGVMASCGPQKAMSGLSDPRGFFRFDDLTDGTCAVIAYLGGYGIGFVEALPTTKREELVQIQIFPPGSLRIDLATVTEPADVPVVTTASGSRVDTLLAMGGFPELRPAVDAREDGGWTLLYPTLPPGSYVISHPSSGEQQTVSAVEGRQAGVEFGFR